MVDPQGAEVTIPVPLQGKKSHPSPSNQVFQFFLLHAEVKSYFPSLQLHKCIHADL